VLDEVVESLSQDLARDVQVSTTGALGQLLDADLAAAFR
jgi:hypothetical protein